MSHRGRFIVFEGGEACGKSTQARRLAERLGALFTFEPGATELGQLMRQIVLDPDTHHLDARAEALLIAADKAQHVRSIIEPALAAGRDVVHMEIGEPDFETPVHAAEAAIEAIRGGDTHYGPSAGLRAMMFESGSTLPKLNRPPKNV